jgi:amidase
MVDYRGYLHGVADRSRLVRRWSAFLEDYPLVLTPFFMRPTFDYDYDETFEGVKDIFDSMIYSYGINYLGLPAGNIPIGLIEGRPSGVQIVGQRFREDMILDAMEVVESQVGVLAHGLWERMSGV